MRFELNKRIATKKTEDEMLAILQEHFATLAESCDVEEADPPEIPNKYVYVTNVRIWDWGTLLKTTVDIELKPVSDGWLVKADVSYTTTWQFCVLAILCLLGLHWLGIVIPMVIFFVQKKMLEMAITKCFNLVQTEVLE